MTSTVENSASHSVSPESAPSRVLARRIGRVLEEKEIDLIAAGIHKSVDLASGDPTFGNS